MVEQAHRIADIIEKVNVEQEFYLIKFDNAKQKKRVANKPKPNT